jgi:protein-S-isoprenylcysteine O-methyltransferase Ste14
MTTIAIMTAVSAIELQEVSKLLPNVLNDKPDVDYWQIAILLLSVLFAIVALVSYIVSADALDVIFNRFEDDDSRHRIIRYYYQSTINPRYAALISLITSFILLVAHYSPLAASMSIGLFFVIGYAHWFPDFNMPSVSTMSSVKVGLSKLVLIGLPVLPVFLGQRC